MSKTLLGSLTYKESKFEELIQKYPTEYSEAPENKKQNTTKATQWKEVREGGFHIHPNDPVEL
jgi:hypothetical protein